MKDVKYLDIVFENCESIMIPIERVVSFDHGTLVLLENKHLEDNSYQSNYINLKISYTDESELQYNSLDYDEPLGMFIGNPTSNNVKYRPNILGRLINHRDIVDIQLLDEAEKSLKDLYVPWHSEDEYDNRNMSIKVAKGLLEIEIKE